MQGIIEKLCEIYATKGFVTEDTIIEILMVAKLPLYCVDYICDRLLSMGVIIRDDRSAFITDEDEGDGEYDRSQIDYELIFDEVLSIDNSLSSFIKQVRQIQPPQHREWINLLPQAKNGNKYAYKRMIEMYLRTVMSIALSIHKKLSAPLAETIQEGCIGLIMAVEKYDMSRHGAFPAYFPLWVRQNIHRRTPFTYNPSIYFPDHIKNKLYSIFEVVKNHQCDECGVNSICINLIDEIANYIQFTTGDAESCIQYYQGCESIETILNEDPFIFSDEGRFEDDLLELCNLQELKYFVDEILDILKPRDKKILQLRYGFVDGEERTLEQVGKEFGLTRSRIGQIEAKAFRKFRHPSRRNILIEYGYGETAK